MSLSVFRRIIVLMIATLLLAACGLVRNPDSGAGAGQAAYPVLLPIDTLLASVPPLPDADPALSEQARAANLRARAAALRQATP